MYILGLTPTDAQITAVGLHLISAFVTVLFIKSKLGILLMIISLMALGLRKLFMGKFNATIIQIVVIALLTSFFISQSSRIVAYQSLQERDGYMPNNQTKLFLTQDMPLVFVYVDSMLNNIVGAVISLLDNYFPPALRFISKPFVLEKNSLASMNDILGLRGNDHLRQEIDSLMNDELLEAYKITAKHEFKLTNDLKESFSRKGQDLLRKLDQKIDLHLQSDATYLEIVKQLSFLAPDNSQIEEQIRNEVMLYRQQSISVLNKISLYLISIWPALIGFLTALLWGAFLPIFMIVVVTHQMAYLFSWIANLILIKFAWVWAYLGHLIAMIVLKQQLNQSDLSVYFYHPSFAYSAVLLMYLGVIILFIGRFNINKGHK